MFFFTTVYSLSFLIFVFETDFAKMNINVFLLRYIPYLFLSLVEKIFGYFGIEKEFALLLVLVCHYFVFSKMFSFFTLIWGSYYVTIFPTQEKSITPKEGGFFLRHVGMGARGFKGRVCS